jgi:hypothetical protein
VDAVEGIEFPFPLPDVPAVPGVVSFELFGVVGTGGGAERVSGGE